MLKSFGLVAAASLLAGCVSVGGPTAAPTLGPSFGITTPAPATPTAAAATPTAVATPTAAPTATPTDAPTATPTDEPTPELTPEPTPDGGENGDLILFDDFVDPTSGWATGETGNSSAQYVDGSLHLIVGDAGQAVWSDRALDAEYGVLLSAAFFTASTDGAVGLLCDDGTGSLYGATLTSASDLVFFSIIGGVSNVLDTRNDLDVELTPGATEGFGLECAGTSTGQFPHGRGAARFGNDRHLREH